MLNERLLAERHPIGCRFFCLGRAWRRPRELPRCTVRATRPAPHCTVRAARPWHHASQCAVAARGSRREAVYDATLGPPWPNRHPEAIPRVQKQKSRHFCKFFAITDCCELPNCGLRRKSAGNRLHDGLFSLCGDRKESVIAKNLQRSRDFCFHDGWIAPTGRFRNGRIAETGQIMQMCGFSLAASRPGLGLPIRRSGSLGHAASGGAG